jgi:hypothetical protein
MKRWEYKTEILRFKPDQNDGGSMSNIVLNACGSNGWELVSVVYLPYFIIYYFKKEKL